MGRKVLGMNNTKNGKRKGQLLTKNGEISEERHTQTHRNLFKIKRKTWKGIMIRNVLARRREYGTYLATACRHRRRLKMQKRDE